MLDSFKVVLMRPFSVKGYRFLNALAIILLLILIVILRLARGEIIDAARVKNITISKLSSDSLHAITT